MPCRVDLPPRTEADDLRVELNATADKLCRLCRVIEVAELGDLLEAAGVATWWTKHKQVDEARAKKEAAAAAKEAEAARVKREALAKLSPAERKALGLT